MEYTSNKTDGHVNGVLDRPAAYSIEQTDAQLKGTAAAIRYTLSFPNATQHLVNIVMEIDTSAPELVLAMPNWVPGSYKVRDFVAGQGDLAVTSADGRQLPFEWIAKNRLRIQTGGARTVRAAYIYYGYERSVRMTHINRFHAFLNPVNCLMYVEGRLDEIHHVAIDHPWKHVSTALSPVDGTTWGALNYDILADSPVEIGDHYVATYERHGAQHEIAITGNGNFDPDWITEQTKTIVDRAVEMWGTLPYDRYVFIIQLLPGQYGGLEHARSSVNMYDSMVFAEKEKAVKLLSLLCHEYFHLWNVKRIRPYELGPFDYNSENYTRMLWLAEGVTSYYDDLMTYRCGFFTKEQYLQALGSEHLSKLLDVPGRRSMSIKDSSYLSWVKLYMATADSNNRFPSYYLKGGVIFLLLDLTIIAESNGQKSLDDGMRALMDRYIENPASGVTEEEFIQIVSRATGVEIGDYLSQWLNSTDELPVEETMDRMGLEWRQKEHDDSSTFGDGRDYPKSPSGRWLGIGVEETKGGVKVARVMRDSPAEAAGIGVDDELIAINGYRATDAKSWDTLVKATPEGGELHVLAASEGRLYETTLRFAPRVTHELVEKETQSAEEKRNMEKWLGR
jgi:predicted metalloprotease with PDZ domain